MGNLKWRYIFFIVLALAVMAARVNLAPAQQVAPAAVILQDDTPEPGDTGELPVTGSDSGSELSERHGERVDSSSNWIFLLIFGIAFLGVVIGLVARSATARTPR